MNCPGDLIGVVLAVGAAEGVHLPFDVPIIP